MYVKGGEMKAKEKKTGEYTVKLIGERYLQLKRLSNSSKSKSMLKVILKALDLLEEAKNI